MLTQHRTLYLCTGLQSSGTTLLSWCFLQRADMDGILDANNDLLTDPHAAPRTGFAWLKTTISSFRTSELMAHYRDLGWTVRPILVCRDVRDVYASLRTKSYGRNGTTAEDPPLRLRFRRFREDWEWFREKSWPILSYDRFLLQPEESLRQACDALDLPWDDAMLAWPKPRAALFDTRHGNETFHRNYGGNLSATLQMPRKSRACGNIPADDLAWLEEEFDQYNQTNGFPAKIAQPHAAATNRCDLPTFQVTRRAKWRLQQRPIKYAIIRAARWLARNVSFFVRPVANPPLSGTADRQPVYIAPDARDELTVCPDSLSHPDWLKTDAPSGS